MKLFRMLSLFALLMGFWLLLSARLDAHLVVTGALAALLVTLASAPLLERTIGPAATHPRVRLATAVPFAAWLLGRMLVSAVQLARIVLDPRLPPEPGIVRFDTQLTSPAARTVLSTAITLVPGTMTLEVEGDVLTIHSFTPDAVEDIASAALQDRIARIFGDGPQPRPELRWESGHTLTGEVVGDRGPTYVERARGADEPGDGREDREEHP